MENYNFNIQEELKKLPGRPGVYLMHDETDQIIYVGKAISLKNRVRQYFQSSRNKGVKIEQMVTHIRRFEYIVTDSELEALVLECNLIKEHRPKYNTMLRDDKTYPYIRVTVGEDFPRVLFSRQQKKDRSRYFGPYTSAGAVKDTIELINKLYQLRTCNRNLPKDIGKDRPCLNYHIHQCNAPCQGYISKEEYNKNFNKALKLIEGDYKQVIEYLEEKMYEASEKMEYEQAAVCRDLIESVKSNGVLTPVLLRSDGEDGYEMISGHRRMHAAAIAGLETIPAIVRELSDDDAVIAMVDANIQREELLPSEKGFAYKMKLDAIKRQGKRVDLTCGHNGHKLGKKSREELGEQVGESARNVQRYIRLTELIPELLDMLLSKQLNKRRK